VISVEQVLGALVARNNARIASLDVGATNPRNLSGVTWHTALVAQLPAIQQEWDAFESAGARLPLLDDLLGESQGASEPWRAGFLVAASRPLDALMRWFPDTVEAVQQVPGIRSALWSLLEPGAHLPPHEGPNRGVLRYHLGIRCHGDTALRVGDTATPYREGEGVLFDDTAEHEAWNYSDVRRVTLFLEVLRPLPRAATYQNRGVQSLLARDHRYRHAGERAAEWEGRLNGGLVVPAR